MGISSLPSPVDWRCPPRARKASEATSRLSGCACREHAVATRMSLESPIAPQYLSLSPLWPSKQEVLSGNRAHIP